MSNYKVTVTSKNDGVHVSVRPKPVAVDESDVEDISSQVQEIIMKYSNEPNTIFNRRKLRNEMRNVLTGLHQEGRIRPKD